MADQLRSKIIEDNPIGNSLDSFRASFNTVCADRGIPCTLDALGQLDLEGRVSANSMPHNLLTNMQMSRILRSFFFPLYKAFQSQACSSPRRAVAPFETIS